MSDYWNLYQPAMDRVRPVVPTNPESAPSSVKEQTALLKNMSTGETIQGEIVSVKGNEVMVRLPDHSVISTKLSGDLQIQIGQNLMFEVSNGANGQIALRALFTNLSGGELLANALADAGIPINADTAEMVEQLVKEELPIGREHLQEVYRDVLEFQELKPAEIVKMHKLGIEVNEHQVRQFSAFINCEERIANDTMNLIASLKNEIVSLHETGNTEAAFRLEVQLMKMLAESPDTLPLQTQDGRILGKDEILDLFQNIISEADNLLAEKDAGLFNKNNDLNGLLREFMSEISDNENRNFSVKELFTAIKGELELGKLPKEFVLKLFEKSEFSEIVGKALEEQWLLKPNEVEDGKNISDFYQKLQHHVSMLSATATESLSASQSLTQSLAQMKENVDFLNQLSQMIPYVQLPLKLNGQSATGDLYVFADKRRLSEKGENITAALHLDMQHLGHLDVFVKLINAKVETDFKVENDATLDFLSNHIDVLNERLKKRGYELQVNLDKMKEPSDIKTDLIHGAKEETVESQPIAYYRLDVRA